MTQINIYIYIYSYILLLYPAKKKNIVPKKHVHCIALKKKQNTNLWKLRGKMGFLT